MRQGIFIMELTNAAYFSATDEELLMLTRGGDISAHLALTKRYFDKKESLAKKASAALASLIDRWDLNHVFFLTFLKATESFEFGLGARFLTFFLTCFRREMIAEASSSRLFPRLATKSLDAELLGSEEGGLTLGDIVPAPKEDPTLFVDYLDGMLQDPRYKGAITEKALSVARLKINGYSFSEIAKILRETPRQCQYLYQIFLKEVRHLMKA